MSHVHDETKDHHDGGDPPSLTQAKSHSSSLLERVRSWVSGDGWAGKHHGSEDEDAALAELQQRIREAGSEFAQWLEPRWEDKLRRVLRARDHDLDAAYLMWHNLAKWRAEFGPDRLTEEDAKWYLSKKVLVSCGRDKEGRPGTYVHGKNHVPDSSHIEDMIKTIVYLFERDVNQSVRTADGFTVLMIDANGCGLRNMDTKLFIGKNGFVHILQDYYPESLKLCMILNGTWLFKMMWKVVAPFLNEKTRKKVLVLDKPEEVLEHFDYEALPEELKKQIKKP